MRMGLAVLDWNEHVDRDVTSVTNKQSAPHHRRQQGRRVLTRKTFHFVQDIWNYAMDACDFDSGFSLRQEVMDDHLTNGIQIIDDEHGLNAD